MDLKKKVYLRQKQREGLIWLENYQGLKKNQNERRRETAAACTIASGLLRHLEKRNDKVKSKPHGSYKTVSKWLLVRRERTYPFLSFV